MRAFRGKTNKMAACKVTMPAATVPKATAPKVPVPKITRTANCKQLFAGPHPISEYMDNIGRVGQVIMDRNLHCHENCTKNRCEHEFTVDVTKRLTNRNETFLKP